MNISQMKTVDLACYVMREMSNKSINALLKRSDLTKKDLIEVYNNMVGETHHSMPSKSFLKVCKYLFKKNWIKMKFWKDKLLDSKNSYFPIAAFITLNSHSKFSKKFLFRLYKNTKSYHLSKYLFDKYFKNSSLTKTELLIIFINSNVQEHKISIAKKLTNNFQLEKHELRLMINILNRLQNQHLTVKTLKKLKVLYLSRKDLELGDYQYIFDSESDYGVKESSFKEKVTRILISKFKPDKIPFEILYRSISFAKSTRLKLLATNCYLKRKVFKTDEVEKLFQFRWRESESIYLIEKLLKHEDLDNENLFRILIHCHSLDLSRKAMVILKKRNQFYKKDIIESVLRYCIHADIVFDLIKDDKCLKLISKSNFKYNLIYMLRETDRNRSRSENFIQTLFDIFIKFYKVSYFELTDLRKNTEYQVVRDRIDELFKTGYYQKLLPMFS